MTIENRLTLLAALLVEGSISKEEVKELQAIPMTQFLPVTDPDQVTAIIRKMIPRQSSSRYVPDSLTVSKAFNSMLEFKFQKLSKNGEITVTRNHHSQYPIDLFDATDRLLLDSNSPRREITTHLAAGESKSLTIEAVGERSPAGKNTTYQITGLFDDRRIRNDDPAQSIELIMMDSKPVLRAPNGLTIETLLAVAIDQLEGLQSGAYACDENATALASSRVALEALKSRTEARIKQGVKNTPVAHTPLTDVDRLIDETRWRSIYLLIKDDGAEYRRLIPLYKDAIDQLLSPVVGDKLPELYVIESLANALDTCQIPRKGPALDVAYSKVLDPNNLAIERARSIIAGLERQVEFDRNRAIRGFTISE